MAKYKFDSLKVRVGHLYSRLSNPTVAVLKKRIRQLEGGVADADDLKQAFKEALK